MWWCVVGKLAKLEVPTLTPAKNDVQANLLAWLLPARQACRRSCSRP